MWMTQAYAENNATRAAFMHWSQTGALQLIPGGTIRESFIREEFEKLYNLLDIRVLVKDRTFAADFAEWAEEKWPKLLQVEYPQNATMMEKPIDDFEASVTDGNLVHENNACLNWQAGHASVFSNHRGFRIIQKPKPDDVRKVDGMVASVMAYWGTKHLPKRNSVYRRRGVLTA
jgi:phage terminase large subunit-like protein